MHITTKLGYTYDIPDSSIAAWKEANRTDPFAVSRMIAQIKSGLALPSDFGTKELHEVRTSAIDKEKTYNVKVTVPSHHP